MRYVGVGRRFVALFIDGLVSLLWVLPLSHVEHSADHFEISLRDWHFAAAAVISLAYFVFLEGVVGATLGKMVMGIRVQRPGGGTVGLGPALIRNLLRVVDAVPYVIPYLVGAIAVWSSPTRQRVGDRAATTVVVRKDSIPDPALAPPGGPPAPPMPPPPPMPGEG